MIPSTMRAVILRQITSTGKDADPRYDAAVLETVPIPKLKSGQVLIQLRAAA